MVDVTCAEGHPVPPDDYECADGHPAVYAPPPRPLLPQDGHPPADDHQPDLPTDPGGSAGSGNGTWVLLSVDGATTTAPTPVLVGRSNNSPLAKALARYEFISRQHLVLERRGEVVTVVDVSKLGTAWGDGRRLAPSERHEASLPLLLRLAHECTLYVEAHEHPAEGTA